MTFPKKRGLALLTVGLMALTACGSSKSGDSSGGNLGKVNVVVSAANSFEFLPAEFGVKLGVWKARGLEVANTYVSGGQYGQAMASGQGDIGMGSGTNINAIAKGVPAPYVAGIGMNFAMMVLVVGDNSDIKSISDLKGKTIGITSVGSLTDALVKVMRKDQGWKDSELKAAPVGGFDQQMAALSSKSTSAFIWTAEAGYQLEEEKKGKVLLNFGDLVKDSVFEAVNATKSAISNRPDAVKAYLQGLFETIDYMKKHKDETVQFMMKQFNMSQFVASSTYDLDIDNLSPDGVIPKANLDGVADFALEVGLLDSKPSLDTYYDGQFVPVTWQPTIGS